MIDRVETPNPVKFSGLIPGEYFGLFVHEVPYDPDSVRVANAVWRCQRLPGPGYRYRLAGAGEVPPGDGLMNRTLAGDTPVHSYGDDELTELNRWVDLEGDQAALRAADRLVRILRNLKPRAQTSGWAITTAVLRRLSRQAARRLALSDDPLLRFARLHRYRPQYNPNDEPDDPFVHNGAIVEGLGAWRTQVGFRQKPFISVLPDLEAALCGHEGDSALECIGINGDDLAASVEFRWRVDRQYRDLCAAIERVLKAYRTFDPDSVYPIVATE